MSNLYKFGSLFYFESRQFRTFAIRIVKELNVAI